MSKIKVITSDGRIWNREEALLAILEHKNQAIVLDLLNEGPCCQTSGIDDLIDITGIDPSLVTIETGNQMPSSRYKEKRIRFAEIDLAKSLAIQSQPTVSSMKNLFSLFIGRSNWQRLGLGAHLYRHHREYSAITFHFNPQSDYHKDNFGLEEYVKRNIHDQSIMDFVTQLPIKDCDIDYPILWNQGAFDLSDRYRDVFCDIICETYFSGRTFFVTEKTWRPIINLRPFIVQGPTWYLHNLHKLGFKTFSQWWDEGYDEDPSDARIGTLRNNIDWIAAQPLSVLEGWYQEMQPTLLHNLRTLQNLTHSQILSTDFTHG